MCFPWLDWIESDWIYSWGEGLGIIMLDIEGDFFGRGGGGRYVIAKGIDIIYTRF